MEYLNSLTYSIYTPFCSWLLQHKFITEVFFFFSCFYVFTICQILHKWVKKLILIVRVNPHASSEKKKQKHTLELFPSLGRMEWSRSRSLTAAQLNINCKGWEFGENKISFTSSHFGKLNIILSKSDLYIIYTLPKFPACYICPWDTFIMYKFCSVFPVILPQISKAYKIIMCSVLQTNVANTWRVKEISTATRSLFSNVKDLS